MKADKRGVQIGLGASSIFMIFVVLCMMILSVLSYTRALQNEKIAQRERLYRESYARSDEAAQLLVDELKLYPDKSLRECLKQDSVRTLLKEYDMETAWQKEELLVSIPVQKEGQLQIRIQKHGKNIRIKAWKTITKGDAS